MWWIAIARAETPLEPEETSAEVVVTAARIAQLREDTTAAVRVLDAEALAATGARTVADALRAVPGLQLTDGHGGAALRMHGYDPRQVLVLIDGEPVIGRVDGALDLGRLPLTGIERIEVLQGAASALYGSDAMGGVINLITRQGDGSRVRAQLGERLTAELTASTGVRSGAWTLQASGRRFGQQPWDGTPDDPATTGDGVDGYGADLSAGWAKDSLESRLSGGYQRRSLTGVDASPTGAVFDRETLEETAHAGWTGAARSSSSLATLGLDASLWRQQYLLDQRSSDALDSYTDTRMTRFSASPVHSRQWTRHTLVTGLDLDAETMTSERLADGLADRQRLAAYAQDEWRVTDAPRLSFAPGVRLDLDGQFGAAATPRLALRFDPVDALTLRASAGRGWRAPDFKELYLAFDHSAYGYVIEGNAALEPESSWGGTVDVSARPARTVELAVHGWCDRADALISVALVSQGTGLATYTYRNVDEARLCGVAPSLAWKPRYANLTASWTRTETRDLEADLPLDGRARDQLTGALDLLPSDGLTLSGQASWTSRRQFTEGESRSWSEPYTWIDVRAAADLAPGLTVEAGLRNLLSADDGGFTALPPRTAWVGFTATGAPR